MKTYIIKFLTAGNEQIILSLNAPHFSDLNLNFLSNIRLLSIRILPEVKLINEVLYG
jgi:hypothetical protein